MDIQKSPPDIPFPDTRVAEAAATLPMQVKESALHKTFSFEEHTCSLAVRVSPQLVYHRPTSSGFLKTNADIGFVRRERERSATLYTYKPLPAPPLVVEEVNFVCTISFCEGVTIDANTDLLASDHTLLERKTIISFATDTDYISAMGVIEPEAARILNPAPAKSKSPIEKPEHSAVDIRTLWRHECLFHAGGRGELGKGVSLDAENWGNAMIMLGNGRWEVKVVYFKKEVETKGRGAKGANFCFGANKSPTAYVELVHTLTPQRKHHIEEALNSHERLPPIAMMEEDPAPAYSIKAASTDDKSVSLGNHLVENMTRASSSENTTSHIIHFVHCKPGSRHGCPANGAWTGRQIHDVSDAVTISEDITFTALNTMLVQKVTCHFNIKADVKDMKGAITLTSGERLVQVRDQESFDAARKVFGMGEGQDVEITLTFAVAPARKRCEVM
ncbi:hypothetical protein LTR78_010752 [Recurvomyces mirabilis]|uniref:Uncharacterized protein n=1 Tax=Recurvomyces mirabilis TaxID=574656 RepID=A0AAE0WG31_9PEZI|nr:hypothetical protein LTR78_010752 [Recurvomyces mirabilis]KAK5155589.1 hypothetical protein LTS14_005850 [Recurvomyces mirabilis]